LKIEGGVVIKEANIFNQKVQKEKLKRCPKTQYNKLSLPHTE